MIYPNPSETSQIIVMIYSSILCLLSALTAHYQGVLGHTLLMLVFFIHHFFMFTPIFRNPVDFVSMTQSHVASTDHVAYGSCSGPAAVPPKFLTFDPP